ncbi:hypothetical protein [Sphingomonas aerophila]|jgi:acetolactate synthase regulatory subunit|uniref:Acetolactate synthase regulatory subunit n=1 Tax=Sphingomonas aerophila TaxID=1344948 RepID=A0A7W9BET5_9SPHN|nr:hypothetical protein [Sphingomonas aerophila]MBB5715619.1 acetolactate synthase regulatory subunit [Sphingomonas aerophila]
MTPDTQLTIRAATSMPVLLRVLNILEQRDVDVRNVRAEFHHAGLVVRVDLGAPADGDCENLLAKLTSLVEVETAYMD